MHQHLRHFAALALLALLIPAPGLALAHGEGLQQTVGGYTVTFALPEKSFFTGRNPVAVSLWDRQGNTPEATVSVLLLAFTPAGNGHGDTHGEAAATDDYSAADDHGEAASADDHGEAASADDHGEAAVADDHAATDDYSAADDHAATD
ncbi:MAG TPA: hypothetical protein PKD53_24525, partial [Chloroflexaceae bacterium]|nr:hypothetical protein [Chloroflexaceae bacterium]